MADTSIIKLQQHSHFQSESNPERTSISLYSCFYAPKEVSMHFFKQMLPIEITTTFNFWLNFFISVHIQCPKFWRRSLMFLGAGSLLHFHNSICTVFIKDTWLTYPKHGKLSFSFGKMPISVHTCSFSCVWRRCLLPLSPFSKYSIIYIVLFFLQ